MSPDRASQKEIELHLKDRCIKFGVEVKPGLLLMYNLFIQQIFLTQVDPLLCRFDSVIAAFMKERY